MYLLCWHQWSIECTAPRTPGSRQPRGTTQTQDRHDRGLAVAHNTAPAQESRTVVERQW